MIAISPIISTPLNVTGLNCIIKRQSVKLDKKHDPTICCLQGIYYRVKNINRLKWKDIKKCIMQVARNKKDGVAILISHKVICKTKLLVINIFYSNKEIQNGHGGVCL
jgi:exonuclease III